MEKGWDLLTPETQALFGIYTLYWQIDQGFDQMLATLDDLNLGHLECQLVVLLVQPLKMGDLARLTMKTPQAVTAAAAALEARGLVSRKRDDKDRRSWVLRLTQDGNTTRELLVVKAKEVFYKKSGLTPDETAVLARLARKFHETAFCEAPQRPTDGDAK